jgi:hypothetical protein
MWSAIPRPDMIFGGKVLRESNLCLTFSIDGNVLHIRGCFLLYAGLFPKFIFDLMADMQNYMPTFDAGLKCDTNSFNAELIASLVRCTAFYSVRRQHGLFGNQDFTEVRLSV